MTSPPPTESDWLRDWTGRGIALILACGLTWIFWWPLWSGGGLIGGDIYPYYFPQKAFLADSLRAGHIPLWNPLVGFGYPTLGESQTAVLYPPNLILYSQFSLNTAYNLSQLLHYILAFMAMWAFSRRIGLSGVPSIYVATVFVYGWFPARICLEWAIIGGAWFAAILWGGAVYLQTGKRWPLGAISLGVGMDLLAGHYNLAFIAFLVLACLPFLLQKSNQLASAPTPRRGFFSILVMVGVGFLIGAVQLLPSWELKTLSQRQAVNEVFSPTYGHLPPLAISQIWQPWSWYAGEELTDRYLERATWLSVPNATNQVEAFVYCGLSTLVLIIAGCCMKSLREAMTLAGFWRWLLLGVVGLILATGWPTYWLADLPGIGFFRGPGRYSLITVFAWAVLGGGILDGIYRKYRFHPHSVWLSGGILLSILTVDLWLVSRQYDFSLPPQGGRFIFYSTMVDSPPIEFRDQSFFKNYFASLDDIGRLYAPGQNVPTLLNVPALPVYLGLGPEIYESEQVRVDFGLQDPELVSKSVDRLRQFGVTHLLLERKIDPDLWEMEYLGEQRDPFLNRAYGRLEPFYFYRLQDRLGRAYVPGHPEYRVHVDAQANAVTVTVSSDRDITEANVVLTDLNYPGWGETEWPTTETGDGLFRTKKVILKPPSRKLKLHWVYRPWTIYSGGLLSLAGLFLSAVLPRFLKRPARTGSF